MPGVAQRTGATVYYLELFPKAAAKAAGRDPVLALMPMPGDVDVVIASELMEAGRAVQRGFVTPDRTTVVASTHRVYAMTEKIALADGRVDAAALIDGCRAAAKRFLAFDMAAIAEATRSPINAVLFGALAGAGALPFGRPAFEAAIRRGRVGVEAEPRGVQGRLRGRRRAARLPQQFTPSRQRTCRRRPWTGGTWRHRPPRSANRCRACPPRSPRACRNSPMPRVRSCGSASSGSPITRMPPMPGSTSNACARSWRSSAGPAPTGALSRKWRASSRSLWPMRTRSGSRTSRSGQAASPGCARR